MERAWAFSATPLARERDWLALVAGLSTRSGFWWLDSALATATGGRFSFAGAEPRAILRLGVGAAPLEALRPLLGREPACADGEASELPFVGGAVVALGYELAQQLEAVPAARDGDPLGFADGNALEVDRLYAFDHRAGRSFAVALEPGANPTQARARARAAARELAERAPSAVWPEPPRPRAPRALRVARGFGAPAHAEAVEQIRAHIAAGDLYQACLTHRLELTPACDPLSYYLRLRERNPAPFAAFLELPEGALASSSPELFLRLDARGWLVTRPIKGTRPRRADAAADRAERAALAASEKDRAENLMIVDLARNDLGRVCELGSVHVPSLFAVESYASVHQLVSSVRGRLAPGRDACDAIRAAFPPGSMTGAPKLAAMTLLARLERARRGPYAGALGYLDARGGCELSVVIRTALFAAGRLALHTGGGIVADSTPRAEWAEAEWKARPLLEVAAELAGSEARETRAPAPVVA